MWEFSTQRIGSMDRSITLPILHSIIDSIVDNTDWNCLFLLLLEWICIWLVEIYETKFGMDVINCNDYRSMYLKGQVILLTFQA